MISYVKVQEKSELYSLRINNSFKNMKKLYF